LPTQTYSRTLWQNTTGIDGHFEPNKPKSPQTVGSEWKQNMTAWQRNDDTEAAPTTRKLQSSTDLEATKIKAVQPQ
jgi:hypothetical protein